MQLSEILKQPDGFTPPDVTVKIEKVYDYKSGESENGPWSFQDVQVTGGRLKLKGIKYEFPKDREGMTVTLRAHSSSQHGLTGLKVLHEEYQGKTYDKLVVTPSAKWEFANPGATPASSNGASTPKRELTYAPPVGDTEAYMAHLFGCASLADQIVGLLKVADEQAVQACFATICIDTKNRGILLPKPESSGYAEPESTDPPFGELPLDDDDIPF